MSDATTTSRTYLIENPSGLHLRPASQLVQVFADYEQCEVQVGVGETRVNGKSIMGLLMLEAGVGSEVTVEVSGEAGEEIHRRVAEVFARRFGEE